MVLCKLEDPLRTNHLYKVLVLLRTYNGELVNSLSVLEHWIIPRSLGPTGQSNENSNAEQIYYYLKSIA